MAIRDRLLVKGACGWRVKHMKLRSGTGGLGEPRPQLGSALGQGSPLRWGLPAVPRGSLVKAEAAPPAWAELAAPLV